MSMKIIISRTDNLGDVILTLPLAGFLKEQYPDSQLFFIGKSYTKAIIKASKYIDFFLDRDFVLQNPDELRHIAADAIIFVFPDKELAQIAKKVGITKRIGTSHRWWHWLYCNKLVNFSRKKATIHEAQLNFKLLEGLDLFFAPTLSLLSDWYGLETTPTNFAHYLSDEKPNIILHPKSRGSAREWHLDNYYHLALYNPDKQFFITGTKEEGLLIEEEKPGLWELANVKNLTGKFSLEEFISFIACCDGLVACSTGPLHIAAALGIHTLGIYPPIEPMHPARWQPIGKKAEVLVLSKECSDCRNDNFCACVNAISVAEVSQVLKQWKKKEE